MSRNIYHRLTVPVTYRFPQGIGEVAVDNAQNWAHKHLQALQTNYRRAPHFERYMPVFEQAYARRWEGIAALNLHLIDCLREALGIGQKPAVCASALSASEDPTERLIDICRALEADAYLAGPGGAGYMDLDRFAQRGVRVLTQSFEHPVYPQLFHGFQSHLSVVDLVFNCGPDSAEVIRKANRPAQRAITGF